MGGSKSKPKRDDPPPNPMTPVVPSSHPTEEHTQSEYKDDLTTASILVSQANESMASGDLTSAASQYSTALSTFQAAGDEASCVRVLLRIAALNMKQQQASTAKTTTDEALSRVTKWTTFETDVERELCVGVSTTYMDLWRSTLLAFERAGLARKAVEAFSLLESRGGPLHADERCAFAYMLEQAGERERASVLVAQQSDRDAYARYCAQEDASRHRMQAMSVIRVQRFMRRALRRRAELDTEQTSGNVPAPFSSAEKKPKPPATTVRAPQPPAPSTSSSRSSRSTTMTREESEAQKRMHRILAAKRTSITMKNIAHREIEEMNKKALRDEENERRKEAVGDFNAGVRARRSMLVRHESMDSSQPPSLPQVTPSKSAYQQGLENLKHAARQGTQQPNQRRSQERNAERLRRKISVIGQEHNEDLASKAQAKLELLKLLQA